MDLLKGSKNFDFVESKCSTKMILTTIKQTQIMELILISILCSQVLLLSNVECFKMKINNIHERRDLRIDERENLSGLINFGQIKEEKIDETRTLNGALNEKFLPILRTKTRREVYNYNGDNNEKKFDRIRASSIMTTTTTIENNKNESLVDGKQSTIELISSKLNNSLDNNFNEHNNLFRNRNIFYRITMYMLNPILFYIDYLYGLVFIVGLIGNLAVIYFIAIKSNSSRSEFERVTDFYICNLTGADLMFISGLPFIIMRNITGKWVLGEIPCKMYMSSTSLNQFASSFLLVAMAFDRFTAVCLPIYAHKFRQLKSAIKICGLIWLISIPLMSPIFNYSKLEDNTLCTIGWPDSKYISYGAVFTVYSFAFGFAMPLLLIAGFYLSILRKLRSTTNCPFNSGSSRRLKNSEARNKRVEHLVVVIICTYTICWSPYWACQFIISLYDESEMDPMLYSFFSIATSLSYANSAVNPIIYAFLNDNFKRRYLQSYRSFILIKLVRRCFNKGQDNTDNNNNNNNLEEGGLNSNNNNNNNNASNRTSLENISKLKQNSRQQFNKHHSAILYDQTGTIACKSSEQLDDGQQLIDERFVLNSNISGKNADSIIISKNQFSNTDSNKQENFNSNNNNNNNNKYNIQIGTNSTKDTSIDERRKGDIIIVTLASRDIRNSENQKFDLSVNENSFQNQNNGTSI